MHGAPRVRVSPDEFLKIVARSPAVVIFRPGNWMAGGNYYMVCEGDYYYLTLSKEELCLPEGCTLQKCVGIF